MKRLLYRLYNILKYMILSLLLSSCSDPDIVQIPSDNHNDRIRFLVIHFTTLNYQDSVDILTEPEKVSAHYLIPERFDETYPEKELKVVQLVDENDRAWHAGLSHWQGRDNINDQSIGIELVNLSNCKSEPDYEQNHAQMDGHGLNIEANPHLLCSYPDFDDQQINLLIKLIKQIIERNPEISPTRIVGHADITPDRRVDPGPRFPWKRLYDQGIGAWYDDETQLKYWQIFKNSPPSIGLIQKALADYGYGILETGILDVKTINTLTVFQMHFRPWQVSGQPTVETAATLFALLEKYFPEKAERLMRRYAEEDQLEKTEKHQNQDNAQLAIILNAEQVAAIEKTQPMVIDRIFKAYQGQGQLKIKVKNLATARVRINGKTVEIKKAVQSEDEATINIGQYTQDGNNYLSVDQVSFKETQSDDNNSERYLRLAINFPFLSKGTPESVGVSSAKLKQIDQLINKEIKQGFPGAVLLVAKNGKIIKHTAYGFAKRYDEDGKQLDAPIKMKKDTVFDLASNTKMYATTFAVMKLVSEGKLNVNQPIRQYLPEYTGNGRDTRLVRDFLQHAAGYRPIFRFYDKNNALGERYFSQNRERTKNILLTQIPFDKGRNIEAKYSDLDFMLLGVLIERITGQSLDEYVNEQFYQPLNLNRTRFNPLQANLPLDQIAATELRGNSRDNHVEFINNRTQVIHGEVHDENAFYAMQGVSGHAGLFSTAEEVATLASMMLNQGGYGDFEFFNRNVIQSFVSPSPLDNTIGLGWRLAGFQQRTHHFGLYASPYAFGHTGWTGTVTVIDPYYDLVIVLLTNKKHTPIMEDNGNLQFKGDTFETGKYGKIISMVYQSFLNQPNSNQVKTDAK